MTERLDLDLPQLKGRFDPWTDVDVFVLRRPDPAHEDRRLAERMGAEHGGTDG